MQKFIGSFAFTLLSFSVLAQPFDAAIIVEQRLPAIVETVIGTELAGEAVVVVQFTFSGNALRGKAICPYQAVKWGSPRIRLRCNRIIPQDHQPLRVEAEFYYQDGLIGVPAQQAPNGSYYTSQGGLRGELLIEQVIGVENR